MNIYRIWQTENRGYDTYDSAVVIASNVEEARNMNPAYEERFSDFHNLFLTDEDWKENYSWAHSPEEVHVDLIGVAIDSKPSIVCASFNAG
jgi:hypothetical protein